MKKTLQDRRSLSLILCLVVVCVFTLTLAYAALNAVLTIQGNAEITASTWDIHLENPIVKSGSATTTVPTITSGNSLTFSTTLNMPGDYYEFTVDVVNGGSIDAMIDKVTKTPELSTEQAKYLKYEVSYQNGESISTKQNIASGVTMPIKVRVEYRSDLSNSDLPSGQVVLNLSLILDYIQSDGSGSSVSNNGAWTIAANGSLDDIGTVVTIGTEKFYTIGTEGNNVKLFTEDSIAKSIFSATKYWGEDFVPNSFTYVYNENSDIYSYVQSYKSKIEDFGVKVEEARLIKYEELEFLGCDIYGNGSCYWGNDNPYDWLDRYVDAYFTGTIGIDRGWIIVVNFDEIYEGDEMSYFGVRPVIVISKDYFN